MCFKDVLEMIILVAPDVTMISTTIFGNTFVTLILCVMKLFTELYSYHCLVRCCLSRSICFFSFIINNYHRVKNFTLLSQKLIYLSLADREGGARDEPPPRGPNSFILIQFSAKQFPK